jgi:predicted extracellular nuclease
MSTKKNYLSTFFIIGLLVLSNITTYAQTNSNLISVVFYNVENLFDTINSPTHNDDEFTPKGTKKWDSKKYHEKLNHIAQVMIGINPNLPEIIGLCEIENIHVLNDLINHTDLKKGNYVIIHQESPDKRGIDVALLYKRNEFKMLQKEFLTINFPNDDSTKTRDILYFKGLGANNDTLNIFVNHWPSRWGGEKETNHKRIEAAKTLKTKSNDILQKNKNAKIVIMGDFNDSPLNESVYQLLSAKNQWCQQNEKDFFNLAFEQHITGDIGSHYYKGEWSMLDQIIVSYPLLKSEKGFSAENQLISIFQPDWLFYEVKKTGEKIPNRTYGGNNYYGGYSDHLPVFIKLKK